MRTDYTPSVLFVYRGTRWQRVDTGGLKDVQNRVLNANQFINNSNITVIGGQEMPERQALSQVIKPKADI